jgi:hypothetical protein
MKKLGFLSFGHWTPSPKSQAQTAADVLLQSIDLAVEAERLDSLLRVKHFGAGKVGFSRHGGSIPPMLVEGGREDIRAQPLVHRQDEPAKLSLGMVASQQSPLPFHLVRRL